MNRGLHVYGEKPLANGVEEARVVRDTYMKNKNKLATQCGTQRHFDPNFDYIRELIHEGAIGDLQDVHAWGNRFHEKTGYPKGTGSSSRLSRLGRSTIHPCPFSEDYFIALNWRTGKMEKSYFDSDINKWPTGSNCLSWNMYRDFGNWQIGDMGSHTMDLAFNPLDADYPVSGPSGRRALQSGSSSVPHELSCINPANKWRDKIRVSWHQGGNIPKSPLNYVDLNKIGHGSFQGRPRASL